MQHHKSVYSSGAEDGLIMGVYLSTIFILQAVGMKKPMLLMAGSILMFAIPVLAYILMRRTYIATRETSTFSSIWLHGIILFLCGSLILGLVQYIYTRFINPSFIADQIRTVADAYRSFGTPESVQIGNTFDRIIEKHLLPSPISLAFSMIWLVSFVGSILSMILALIVKALNKKKTPY